MSWKLLAPDILDLTRGLTPPVLGAAFAAGLFLWVLGAASHRFWLALLVTVTAGVVGLQFGPAYDIQPLVAGLLLALAAGALALSLVRILLFLMGGAVALALLRAAGAHWNEPVCFVSGGLAGVFLYRWWVTVLSSFTGSLLMSYATLSLLDRLGKLESVPWSERNAPLLNWAVAMLTLLGVVGQFLVERRRKRNGKGRKGARDEPAPVAGAAGAGAAAAMAVTKKGLEGWWNRLPRIQIVRPERRSERRSERR